jgi:hypothetical protein
MTALQAFRDGIRRVNRAPAILAAVWLLTLAVSLPLGLAMRTAIQDHLGSSLAADQAVSGVNYDWMQEFGEQATGLATTFRPTIIGFGAVLDNLSGFMDNVSRPIAIVGAASAYIVLWIFLAGGIIDRYARGHATRAHGFFSASGVFFFRFVRLAIVMMVTYGLLFYFLHPWLFDRIYPRLTRELSVERTAFLIRFALYVAFGLGLAACNLIFDYTKVRAVIEDRRSMLGALAAAIRFASRNAGAAALLYAIDFALFMAVVAAYALIAPGAGGSGLTMWLAFALGQLYICARLWVKLVFWASEAAFFQGRLAHAGYLAAPVPVWPESPVVGAIGN